MQNAPEGRQHESIVQWHCDINTGRTENNLYISFYLEKIMDNI